MDAYDNYKILKNQQKAYGFVYDISEVDKQQRVKATTNDNESIRSSSFAAYVVVKSFSLSPWRQITSK